MGTQILYTIAMPVDTVYIEDGRDVMCLNEPAEVTIRCDGEVFICWGRYGSTQRVAARHHVVGCGVETRNGENTFYMILSEPVTEAVEPCADCDDPDADDQWEMYEGTPLCCVCVAARSRQYPAPSGYAIDRDA